MKEHIGKIFLGLFSFCLIWGILLGEYHREHKGEAAPIYFRVGKEVIQARQMGEIYYLFLPSYVSMGKMELVSYSPEIYLIKNGETFSADKNMDKIVPGENIQAQFADNGMKFKLCVLQSKNVPAVFLETRSGELQKLKEDKEYKEPGSLVYVDCEGKRSKKYALETIGGRGNTSFAGYDKKPFSIRLESPESLLGLPAGEKYALISNASDPSLIRNDLARRMEKALGIEFSHPGQFVDLYINGEYEGNYYLCDDIEIGTERIRVADMQSAVDAIYSKNNYEAAKIYETEDLKARELEVNPADITGGYLMEREYEQRFRLEYEEIGSAFITEQGEHFVMKGPEYCSVEQIEYISQYVNQAEKAIMSENGRNPENGKNLEEYLDLDSFAKKYLVEEITKNYDAGVSSSYYYKKSDSEGGKLFAGPGWDYDMSLGNYVEWMEEFSADPTGISELAFHTYASPWYTKLYEKEVFYQKVKEYYWKYAEPFLNRLLTDGISAYQETLEASAEMDRVRWEEELKKNIYYESREETFEDLKEFVSKRKAYLDEAWK